MYLSAVDRLHYHLVEGLIRREQVVRDRPNFTYHNDTDFIDIFRLSKEPVLSILNYR